MNFMLPTTYVNFINESKMIAEDAKDNKRINDIISKAKGNHDKEIMFARNMAKSITDPKKSERRYLASQEILGDEHDVTKIFFDRFNELNGNSSEKKFKEPVPQKTLEYDKETMRAQNSWITKSLFRKIDKFIKDYRVESFFKGNAVTLAGRDIMSRNGRKWTEPMTIIFNKLDKPYKLVVDVISDEGGAPSKYVISSKSDRIFRDDTPEINILNTSNLAEKIENSLNRINENTMKKTNEAKSWKDLRTRRHNAYKANDRKEWDEFERKRSALNKLKKEKYKIDTEEGELEDDLYESVDIQEIDINDFARKMKYQVQDDMIYDNNFSYKVKQNESNGKPILIIKSLEEPEDQEEAIDMMRFKVGFSMDYKPTVSGRNTIVIEHRDVEKSKKSSKDEEKEIIEEIKSNGFNDIDEDVLIKVIKRIANDTSGDAVSKASKVLKLNKVENPDERAEDLVVTFTDIIDDKGYYNAFIKESVNESDKDEYNWAEDKDVKHPTDWAHDERLGHKFGPEDETDFKSMKNRRLHSERIRKALDKNESCRRNKVNESEEEAVEYSKMILDLLYGKYKDELLERITNELSDEELAAALEEFKVISKYSQRYNFNEEDFEGDPREVVKNIESQISPKLPLYITFYDVNPSVIDVASELLNVGPYVDECDSMKVNEDDLNEHVEDNAYVIDFANANEEFTNEKAEEYLEELVAESVINDYSFVHKGKLIYSIYSFNPEELRKTLAFYFDDNYLNYIFNDFKSHDVKDNAAFESVRKAYMKRKKLNEMLNAKRLRKLNEAEEEEEIETEETEIEDKQDNDEAVELEGFVIKVDDVEAGKKELEDEYGIENVSIVDENGDELNEDEDTEETTGEGYLKVDASDWELLKTFLQDKGVDIAEVFGGDIEVEEDDEEDDEDIEFHDIEDLSDEDSDITEEDHTDDVVNENKTEFTAEERKELAKKGEAMPDGSFPIRNSQDLKDAIKSYGLAKNKAEAKKWIMKRAKELKKEDLIPADWK